ncbi:hypothetical protein IAD21_01839 [Abditibacteriota bacterium]|nr:hypothetical protein IAD21_01839 [Abditibacteriota bacterium]
MDSRSGAVDIGLILGKKPKTPWKPFVAVYPEKVSFPTANGKVPSPIHIFYGNERSPGYFENSQVHLHFWLTKTSSPHTTRKPLAVVRSSEFFDEGTSTAVVFGAVVRNLDQPSHVRISRFQQMGQFPLNIGPQEYTASGSDMTNFAWERGLLWSNGEIDPHPWGSRPNDLPQTYRDSLTGALAPNPVSRPSSVVGATELPGLKGSWEQNVKVGPLN